MKRKQAFRPFLALAAVFASVSTWAAGVPPGGVYSCYDARMDVNVPGCVRTAMGCTGLVITPMPVVMFGLIDGATYADHDGKQGHYTYDPAAGILAMTDGPRQGWRYRKTAEWSFTLIDNQTGQDHYTCPLEKAKDPRHGPW